MIILYILCLLFTLCHNEKIITKDFQFEQYRPYIKFNQSEGFLLETFINTYIPFSLFDKDYENVNSLDNCEQKDINLEEIYSCYHYHSTFTFDNDVSLKDLSVYLTRGYIEAINDQGIGLSYKFHDESFSFVHQLYNNKLIDHLKFAFKGDPDVQKGYIYFGGIPNNAHSILPYKGYCNVIEDDHPWGCHLTKIQIDKNAIELKGVLFFHTAIARIYFIKEIYNTIVYNYFNDLIMSKNCTDIVGGTNGNFLRCDSKILERKNSKVILVFDHMKITFPLMDLFYMESDYYISTFYSSPFDQYDDYDCIIGYRFINAFNYTVFDYEQKNVQFYSDKVHIEMLSNMPLKLMYLFSSVIMLYAIILLLFTHNK